MNYKYKKYQIFGKRLKVPKDVLSRVYFSELSLEDYIKYVVKELDIENAIFNIIFIILVILGLFINILKNSS